LVSFIENWLILSFSERGTGGRKGPQTRRSTVGREGGNVVFSPFLSIYINDGVFGTRRTESRSPLDGRFAERGGAPVFAA
jgi:hypothetical protein